MTPLTDEEGGVTRGDGVEGKAEEADAKTLANASPAVTGIHPAPGTRHAKSDRTPSGPGDIS